MTVGVNDTVTKELRGLAWRLKNLDAALADMAESNVTETKMRFEQAKDPNGDDWAGLAKSTLAKPGRAKHGGEAQILQDQRHLYDSVHPEVVPGVGFTVGVAKTYGRIHQLGGMAGRGRKVKIEARPYLGVSEEGGQELVAIMRDHLARESG